MKRRDSLEHALVQVVESVHSSLESLVLGRESEQTTTTNIQSRKQISKVSQPQPATVLACTASNTVLDLPGKRDSLGHIVRVDLSEPLPSTLHGVLEVLVDSREVDRGYGRR